jgi:membrane protein DedA with SNARE-associated domain/rhodanese-related sulfurtransferase
MEALLGLIATYGLVVVFANVFIDQGGIPIPAYPAIIVTSAVATERGESVVPILVVATVAAVMADWLWFVGGRRLGSRLVRAMCRLSLSPDSCVMTTRGIYGRWGIASLVVAKFAPGFAAVATTLAGESGTKPRIFLFFDGIGALLWAGVAVALGVVFHDAVDDVLASLDALGHFAVPVLVGVFVAFVAWKWWRRQRFLRQLRMARITPEALKAMLDTGATPLILDVRNADQRARTGWIPGAVFVSTPDEAEVPPHTEVIVYCDCPDEKSAAVMARALKRRGFGNIRPLAGGFDAWRSLGHAVSTGAAYVERSATHAHA